MRSILIRIALVVMTVMTMIQFGWPSGSVVVTAADGSSDGTKKTGTNPPPPPPGNRNTRGTTGGATRPTAPPRPAPRPAPSQAATPARTAGKAAGTATGAGAAGPVSSGTPPKAAAGTNAKSSSAPATKSSASSPPASEASNAPSSAASGPSTPGTTQPAAPPAGGSAATSASTGTPPSKWQRFNDGVAKLDSGAAFLGKLAAMSAKWQEKNDAERALEKEFALLSMYDGDATPWAGAPMVPAACEGPTVDAATGLVVPSPCQVCFAGAQRDLDVVRWRLERGRRIYRAGMAFLKALSDAADAAGDGSGIAGLISFRWRQEIRGRQEPVKRAYDEAYTHNMDSLLAALMNIGDCERTSLEELDWYNRYGFILYEAFAAQYRRAD
jgi:hypothetical protein